MAWDDIKIETYVARMLRTGVIVAALVVFAGGVLYLAHSHGPRKDYAHFDGEPHELCNPAGIVARAARLDARGLIRLGLLILIATPVARVAMCIAGFYFEKDHMYVAISAIVFAVLLYSLFFQH
jgi:uncharacterized membrane protein